MLSVIERDRYMYHAIIGTRDYCVSESEKIFFEFPVKRYGTMIVSRTLQPSGWQFVIKRLAYPIRLKKLMELNERNFIRRKFNRVYDAMLEEMSKTFRDLEKHDALEQANHIKEGLKLVQAIITNPDCYVRGDL